MYAYDEAYRNYSSSNFIHLKSAYVGDLIAMLILIHYLFNRINHNPLTN